MSFGMPTLERVTNGLIDARNYVGNKAYGLLTQVIPTHHVNKVFDNPVWAATFGSSNAAVRNSCHAAAWGAVGIGGGWLGYRLIQKIYAVGTQKLEAFKAWYYAPANGTPSPADILAAPVKTPAEQKADRQAAKAAAQEQRMHDLEAKFANLETKVAKYKSIVNGQVDRTSDIVHDLLMQRGAIEQLKDQQADLHRDLSDQAAQMTGNGRMINGIGERTERDLKRYGEQAAALAQQVKDLTYVVKILKNDVVSASNIAVTALEMKGATKEQLAEFAKHPAVVERCLADLDAGRASNEQLATLLHASQQQLDEERKSVAKDRDALDQNMDACFAREEQLQKDHKALRKEEKRFQKERVLHAAELKDLDRLLELELRMLEEKLVEAEGNLTDKTRAVQAAADAKTAAETADLKAKAAVTAVAGKTVVDAKRWDELREAVRDTDEKARGATQASVAAATALAAVTDPADPSKAQLEQDAVAAKEKREEKAQLARAAKAASENAILDTEKNRLEQAAKDAADNLADKIQLAADAEQAVKDATDAVRQAREAMDHVDAKIQARRTAASGKMKDDEEEDNLIVPAQAGALGVDKT